MGMRAYLLLFFTLFYVSFSTLPPHQCYEGLCSQKTGYYSAVRGRTELLLPWLAEEANSAHKVCLELEIGLLCEYDQYLRFSVPANLSYTVVRATAVVTLHNQTEVRHASEDFYIVPLRGEQSYSTEAPAMTHAIQPYSLLLSDKFYVELKSSEAVAHQTSAHLTLKVETIMEQTLVASSTYIESPTKIEPGTWFLSLSPQGGGTVYPTFYHMDFVLSREDLASQRFFPAKRYIEGGFDTVSSSSLASLAKSAHVCIWGSNTMDGQKQIWLRQMALLAPRLRFSYVMQRSADSDEVSVSPSTGEFVASSRSAVEVSLDALLKQHQAVPGAISVFISPLSGVEVLSSELDIAADDGDTCAGRSQERVFEYMHRRMQRARLAASGKSPDEVVATISPSWVRNVYRRLVSFTQPLECDVVVYGNTRGYNADVLIADVASLLSVPTVAELLNLFVHADTAPDVLVGPSAYSVRHESVAYLRSDFSMHPGLGSSVEGGSSITEMLATGLHNSCSQKLPSWGVGETGVAEALLEEGSRLRLERWDCGPLTAVIPPSVDSQHFSPRPRTAFREANAPVTVAFVGRIAVEKNIGLFVLAAHALVQSLLPREKAVNFLVVGAGALQANVEELVRRLHIAHLFRFTGWVARSDLPTVLSAVDIVVNPSIRGWSETFCIANIEVMSMSIPLVTLAVGGVGQYVRPSEQTMRADNATLFSIGDNALIVHEASPSAIGEAVKLLVQDVALRSRLGAAGRETVVNFFREEQQMARYAELYNTLAEAGRNHRKSL